MFVLHCKSEQALLMAVKDFNEVSKSGRNLIPGNSYYVKEGVFEIPVNSLVMEKFRLFILKSKCYWEYFKISVVQEDVRGFKSEAAAMKAIETLNKVRRDCCIDTSCEIEELKCIEGSIFVPNIQQQDLEKIFWEFVNSNISLKEKVRVGREQCKKRCCSLKPSVFFFF